MKNVRLSPKEALQIFKTLTELKYYRSHSEEDQKATEVSLEIMEKAIENGDCK